MKHCSETTIFIALVAACTGSAFVPPTPFRFETLPEKRSTTRLSMRSTSPREPDGASLFERQWQQQSEEHMRLQGGVRGVAGWALGDAKFSGFAVSSIVELVGGGGPNRVETMLPQDPKADSVGRQLQLFKKQQAYKWGYSNAPVGVPFLEGFPPEEEFPQLLWVSQLASCVARTVKGATRRVVPVGEVGAALSDPDRARAFAAIIGHFIEGATLRDRPGDVSSYQLILGSPIKTPDSEHDFDDDDTFARLRLQGGNCVTIEKCSAATREKLKILDADPEYAELREKVDSLIEAGKLFVVDHDILKGVRATPLDGRVRRFLAPSIALFEVVDDELLPIRPIGIQLSQGETATPIFTPDDGSSWLIAKTCFEAADFLVHQIFTHIGNTHFVLEGAIVAMNRQLPREHPIYGLLMPHVEGTAFVNWGLQSLLMEEGGPLDRLFPIDAEDRQKLLLEQTTKRMSKDFSPHQDMKERGITKDDFPGRYPYRDFGLQYYDAIHAWVTDYLKLYYTTEDDVSNDNELAEFVDELCNLGEMKVLEGWDEAVDKFDRLAKVVASLIYTASTLHAAVNFPQRSINSFIPASPAAVYEAPPMDKRDRSFLEYLAYLPPMGVSTLQVVLTTVLGSVSHTRLGDYEAHHFEDERVREPLRRFQQAIAEIEGSLQDENSVVVAAWRKRGKAKPAAANFAYKTLLPDNVPQSINI